VIAGREGNATSAIRDAIERTGMRDAVMLLGDRSDVADLLCGADVFVLPSYREGMPGAVIEAIAMEVPVVASDIPQVREVTADRAALLVTPGDVEGFAAAITRCVDDLVATAARVTAGYERFTTRFTVQRTAAMMVEFYDNALGP